MLRRRGADDAATVVGWVTDPDALHLFTGPRLRWPLTPDQLTTMERLDGLTAWVADTSDGVLAGHFDLTLNGPVARLGRVIVNPALRGQGLAVPLVSLALTQSRALGATTVRLTVISGNVPALRAYRRAGFRTEPMPERPDATAMSMSWA